MAKQKRGMKTRETVLQAAGVVFSKTSYAAATLSDVIAEAGVTQGALYFHFDSKLDLATQVIARQHELSISLGNQFMSRELPALANMIELSGSLANQITTDSIVRGGLRLSTETPELFPDYASEPYLDWIEAADQLLRRAIGEGQVLPQSDIGALARYVISAFTGVQVVSQAVTQWRDLYERVEEMWTFLLPSIVVDGVLVDIPSLAALSRPSAVATRNAEST